MTPVNHRNKKMKSRTKMMRTREIMDRILWCRHHQKIEIGVTLVVKISVKARIDSNIINH